MNEGVAWRGSPMPRLIGRTRPGLHAGEQLAKTFKRIRLKARKQGFIAIYYEVMHFEHG